MSKPHQQLTRFAPGSFGEFTWIAVPLIVSMLSRGIMLFVDRLVMAKSSTDSLNALTAAGTNVAVVLFAVLGIAGISQVFAGQYNGAGDYKNVSRPIWQMIWFSLLCSFASIPMGFVLPQYTLAPLVYEQGSIYFRWCMLFIFQAGIIGALGAFFMAIGKTYYVTYGAILANIVNLVLVVAFVFGVDGYIEPQGIRGAAFAHIIAEIVEIIYFLILFLRPRYQKKYNTHHWRFDGKLFWDCLRVGGPTCVSHVFEISAWSVVTYILSSVSFPHMTVYSVFQTVFILFAYIISGMEKGLTTLAANAIGAKNYPLIKRSLMQGFKMLVLFTGVLMLPIALNPNLLIDHFVCGVDDQSMQVIRVAIQGSLIWVLLYTVFDGLGWLISGVLTAAGDTKFIMIVNVINVWLLAVMPVYITAHYQILAPSDTWIIQTGYVVMNVIVVSWRYRSGKWKKIQIV